MGVNVTIFRLDAETLIHEPVTIIIEGDTAHCDKPCPFDKGPSFSLRLGIGMIDPIVLCRAVPLSGNIEHKGQLPVDTDSFPKCWLPTNESALSKSDAPQGNSNPEQER